MYTVTHLRSGWTVELLQSDLGYARIFLRDEKEEILDSMYFYAYELPRAKGIYDHLVTMAGGSIMPSVQSDDAA